MLGLAERVEGWKARGWKLSSGRPTANVDLWTQVLARVEFWERFGVEILMWEVKKGVNRDANGLLRHAEVSNLRLTRFSLAPVLMLVLVSRLDTVLTTRIRWPST